jgi:hypothetical protein
MINMWLNLKEKFIIDQFRLRSNSNGTLEEWWCLIGAPSDRSIKKLYQDKYFLPPLLPKQKT